VVRPVVKLPVVAASNVTPEVLAIGVSTGGPTALHDIMPQIPANFPLPVLIVQHMPPIFTKLLAERLSSRCEIKVEEAKHGMVVEPGRALVAPGDFHMRVTGQPGRAKVVIDQGPQENSCRPAVDPLFRSVAEVWGQSAIGVVLTGMGQDGLLGAEVLRTKGAFLVAQDEASSVVWGMPGFVAKAGLAHKVLPLRMIIPEILERCQIGTRSVRAS
jgi:two-component system, chemotaxis family, protein-glutamate methylesterase/glutaminase